MITLKPYTRDTSADAATPVYQSWETVVKSTGSTSGGQNKFPPYRLRRTLNGYKNPDWRSKILRKEDATTPLEVRFDDIKFVGLTDPQQYVKDDGYSKTTYTSALLTTPEYTSMDLEFPIQIDVNWSSYKEARNIALAYQRKYVSEVTQPLQSQVFLGEIKETLEFLHSPFGKMRALANSGKVARYNANIKHYRKAAIKHRGGVFERTSEGRLLLSDVADAWFEVQFAALPLVADINAAIGVSLNHQVKRRSSFTGKGQQNLTERVSSWSMPSWPGQKVMNGKLSVAYYIHTGINFNDATNTDGLAGYLQDSFLEFRQFIPTAWELTPGSWFVDYFVNVSDILNSVAESSKVTRQYEVHTAVADYVRIYSFVPGSLPAGVKVLRTSKGGYTELSRRYVSRKASSDNFPSVNFTLPVKPKQLVNSALYLSRKFANIFR